MITTDWKQINKITCIKFFMPYIQRHLFMHVQTVSTTAVIFILFAGKPVSAAYIQHISLSPEIENEQNKTLKYKDNLTANK